MARPRILHVEDEEEWRSVVRNWLPEYDVDSARSLPEAEDCLQRGVAYDVALVDLNLVTENDGDGGKVLDQLRKHHPATRRIVMTGSPPGGPLLANIFKRFDAEEIIIKAGMNRLDLRKVVEEAVAQGPGGLSQPLKLLRSALRQEFRVWYSDRSDQLRTDVRDAKADVYDANRRISQQSPVDAEASLDAAMSREAEFNEQVNRLRGLLDSIRTLEELETARNVLRYIEQQWEK